MVVVLGSVHRTLPLSGHGQQLRSAELIGINGTCSFIPVQHLCFTPQINQRVSGCALAVSLLFLSFFFFCARFACVKSAYKHPYRGQRSSAEAEGQAGRSGVSQAAEFIDLRYQKRRLSSKIRHFCSSSFYKRTRTRNGTQQL